MAMPDDVSDDLDLLRRVFPKWQCDNILSYLVKAPSENRVKHAICKYIYSHDLHLNRNDCETDAKLVHEIFPEVPFADIFRKITIFGHERNRVRICLRLLMSECGFKTNSSSDFEIDSQEIKALVKSHASVVEDLNSTLTSLNNIRNKYGSREQKKKSRWSPIDSDNNKDDLLLKSRDKVVLTESPEADGIVDAEPSTSKEGHVNDFSESSEDSQKNTTDSSETSCTKARKFSIDLEQVEDFFNNSDLDFSQNLEPVQVAQIKNIQVDKIDVEKSVSINGDTIVCANPFEDVNNLMKSNNKKDLIDLTTCHSRRHCGIPYNYPSSNEVINLDTQDINSEVIIEEKRVPEPIIVKIKKLKKTYYEEVLDSFTVDQFFVDNSEKNVENIDEPEAIAGPSGMQSLSKRKTKLLPAIELNFPPKKPKMDDSVIEVLDTSVDPVLLDDGKTMTALMDIIFEDGEDIINRYSPPDRRTRNSLLMYDDLLDKKKATLSQTLNTQESIDESWENVEESPEIAEDNSNSQTVIDEGLYFPLLEIFPEACPAFLKKLCNGKVNNPGELDRLISEVLDREDYPRRTKVDEDNNQSEICVEDQLEILIQVLPDADPMYLKKQIEECNGSSEAIKQFINEAMENKSYPTLKEYQRKQQLSTQSKQYTTDFNVEKYLEQIPDPETYFKDNNNIKTFEEFSFEERDYLQAVLKSAFNMLPMRIINTKLSGSKTVSVMFDELYDSASKSVNHMKNRRKVVPGDTVLQNIPFLQEVAYNVNRASIISYHATRSKLLADRREQHRFATTLETCCCCYDDTLLPEEVVQCETGCDSCKVCVQKSTEVAFGEGKTEFPCVGGCGKEYSMKILQDALSKKLFSKVAQKRQVAEVRAAGLEDLEQCPFCDFANIPSAEDRLFRCFNPECMKESCRKCKEPNHIPLRCEEVEKDADVQARTEIENRMTEALLRSCWKCQTKFIKSDGCNKMTCPKCNSCSCYVCGKAVTDYKHFNGQGGDRYDLCPLYSDTNKLHEEAVLKAAQQAKSDMDPNALKHDPTADLQKHFVEYNKKNPIVLPPGVHINDYNPRPQVQNHMQVVRQVAHDWQRQRHLDNNQNAARQMQQQHHMHQPHHHIPYRNQQQRYDHYRNRHPAGPWRHAPNPDFAAPPPLPMWERGQQRPQNNQPWYQGGQQGVIRAGPNAGAAPEAGPAQPPHPFDINEMALRAAMDRMLHQYGDVGGRPHRRDNR